MDDLREIARGGIDQLERLAAQFPKDSRGHKAIKSAARRLLVTYIYNSQSKAKYVMKQIGKGNRKIVDLVAETG
ncbi:MAG TPA: hypothetical protein VHQ01_03625, partial [Pyrinomonadaceae bacterium]|nr:hypothetical protein [Pyrinomonadaceae bacterium]